MDHQALVSQSSKGKRWWIRGAMQEIWDEN
jgi:hypothetical protein